MELHSAISDARLRKLIKTGTIKLGGNKQLKIVGTLACRSGKRMKRANRVFFADIQEARALGYRPCGHCMKQAYHQWKNV